MNNNSSKQVLLSVIGVAILVVAVVGVSFAFFNYSRTGTEVNGITVGSIYFTADTSKVMLNNAFPVTEQYARGVQAGDATEKDVAVVTVTFGGNTSYDEGIDFEISAVPDASNTIGAGIVSTIVETPTGVNGLTIDEKATELKYGEKTVLCSGNITSTTRVDGTITIRLFVDKEKVLITDTKDDPGTQTIVGNYEKVVTTGEWNNKVYAFRINVWAVQSGSVNGTEHPGVAPVTPGA